MKKITFLSIISLGLLFSNATFSQDSKKEMIKVSGSCGMCKKKIEKAAKSAGAEFASWNADKQELEVSYVESKTTNKDIQQAIAKVGYDTQDYRADDKTYDNLPGCCQYERKALSPVDKNVQ